MMELPNPQSLSPSSLPMRLALTLGDPNGIGPEVVLRALTEPDVRALAEFTVVGSPVVAHYYATRYRLTDALNGVAFEEAGPDVLPQPGRLTAEAGAQAMEAVARAADLCLDGSVGAMVTAPLNKAAIHAAGYDFPGHTEFLAERAGGEALMLMVRDALRVALVTTHLPLRRVPDAVTEAAVLAKLHALDAALRQDFGLDRPRLALLGLNPHAGDEGVLGTEEQDVLAPALDRARTEGLTVSGPHPADAFFGRRGFEQVDAVLSPYHDQGLVGFKALAMGGGVNVTAGLRLVRTSPDHGTAFDIAGHGRADAESFVAAIRQAVTIARHRRAARG